MIDNNSAYEYAHRLKRKRKIINISIALGLVAVTLLYILFPTLYLYIKYKKPVAYIPTYFSVGHPSYDFGFLGLDGSGYSWNNAIWKYNCQSKDITIEWEDHKFYDDYQMEEVEEWALKILQEKVDKNIDFVYFRSDQIYGLYTHNSNDSENRYVYGNTKWQEDDVINLLVNNNIEIYIHTDNADELVSINELDNKYSPNAKYYEYKESIEEKFIKAFPTETEGNSFNVPGLHIHSGYFDKIERKQFENEHYMSAHSKEKNSVRILDDSYFWTDEDKNFGYRNWVN